jgi:hypothetical protein
MVSQFFTSPKRERGQTSPSPSTFEFGECGTHLGPFGLIDTDPSRGRTHTRILIALSKGSSYRERDGCLFFTSPKPQRGHTSCPRLRFGLVKNRGPISSLLDLKGLHDKLPTSRQGDSSDNSMADAGSKLKWVHGGKNPRPKPTSTDWRHS